MTRLVTLISLVTLIVFSALIGAAAPAAAAPSARPASAIEEVDAKIEIVWPHGNAPVARARLANITVYLFEPGTKHSVPCDFDRTVRLWRALNNNPASNSGMPTPTRRIITRNGVTFPVWDFNNVDVSAAADGANKLYFYVTVDGIRANFNVWSHGADARTYLPQPKQPFAAWGYPEQVDARIQVVWPHQFGVQRPVTAATHTNISVALFHAEIPNVDSSVAPDFNRRVILYKALNNNPMEYVGVGVKRLVRSGGVVHPVWDFNNVDVSAARDPLNKYYFRVLIDDTRTFSTIWSHGADARTYFPAVDQPTAGCGPGVIPTVTLSPTSGPSGTVVQFIARGFPPNTFVTAGKGPAFSEFTGEVGRGQTDAQGVFRGQTTFTGQSGMRWVIGVSTPGGGVSAISDPFLITPGPATLRYMWPTWLPANIVIRPDRSWTNDTAFVVQLVNRSGGPFDARITGGSAEARAQAAGGGRPVTVRGQPGTYFTTGAGVSLFWEEAGHPYAVIGSMNLSETLAVAEALEPLELTEWHRRLANLR